MVDNQRRTGASWYREAVISQPRSKKIRPAFLLGAVAAVAVLTAALAGAEKPDITYLELVKRANSGDTSVGFRELRLACAKADTCDARGDSKDLIAVRRASQSHDYKEAARIAEKLIAEGFPNIEAHAICADAYAALSDPEKAKFHQTIASGLIRSIMATGDGKSKESAFEVIGTQEEHVILSVLGLPAFGNQSLMPGKPHSYDVIEVNDAKSGQKISVYFNIDAFYPMKGLR
jgi:hypothetical protein